MAGFSGIDDYQTETTTNGKLRRVNFNRTIDTGATSAAGRWHSLLTTGGTGGPMTLTGTAGTGIVLNRSTPGALPIPADVAPDLRFLSRIFATTPSTTAVPATVLLTDLLHVYPSCALTGTPSTMSNHPTWTGTGDTRMTSAVGVECSLLVTTATTAGNGQITPTYFDESGNSTAAPSSLYAPSATTPTGCFYGMTNTAATVGGLYMPRAANDLGVQRIASYVINTGATSGVGAFLLHRPIYEFPLAAANTPSMLTLLNDDPALARNYDDACLGFLINIGGALTAGGIITGSMNLTWG